MYISVFYYTLSIYFEYIFIILYKNKNVLKIIMILENLKNFTCYFPFSVTKL